MMKILHGHIVHVERITMKKSENKYEIMAFVLHRHGLKVIKRIIKYGSVIIFHIFAYYLVSLTIKENSIVLAIALLNNAMMFFIFYTFMTFNFSSP